MQENPRLVFIGWGAINSRVGELLRKRRTRLDIVAIATANTPEARAQLPAGIPS
jgi:aspartate dehydrogenase